MGKHNNKLTNYHILITRPGLKGAELGLLIEAHGGSATHFPTIAFLPSPDVEAFQEAMLHLNSQDWLIFVSPQAVRAMSGFMPITLGAAKFAAVGAGTAALLTQAGYSVAACPSKEWSAEGLLQLPEFQSVAKKKIAIIRGAGGREILEKVLTARGAHVLSVLAYQRVLPDVDVTPYLTLLQQNKINAIVCTSFEGVKNLKILFGSDAWPQLKIIPLVVVSERIKLLAQDLGFQTIWVARNASHEAILEILKRKQS